MSAARQDKDRLTLLARLPIPEPDPAQRRRATDASRERFASAASSPPLRQAASRFWQRLRDAFGKLRSAWIVPLGALATAGVLAVAVIDRGDDRHVAGDPSPEVGKLARVPQQDAADGGFKMGARPTPRGPMLDQAPPARRADDGPLQTWVAGDLRLGYRATSKGLQLYEMPPGGEPRAMGDPVRTGETTAAIVDALRVTGPAGEVIAVRLDVPQPGTTRGDHAARLRWIVFLREAQGFSRSAELEHLLQNEVRLIDAERRLEEALRQK